MDEYLALIRRYRIAWIHGYPSAITLLARHAARIGWSAPRRLKGILPISESLLPEQRETIRRAFGDLPIVRFYGLTEKVAFAGEVPGCLDHYEFEPLYGVAEVVDEAGSPVAAGERGRIVGTGFVSTGMPLIRYDTGDQATVVEHARADNCWRLRVTGLHSVYKQDYLVTEEGGLVTPTIAYIYTNLVQDYQFTQTEPGRAELRIVPAHGVSREELEFVAPKMATVSDGLMHVNVEIVDEIPAGPRGKRRVVLQHLDLTAYGGPDQHVLEPR
jgi:phenylacetate-CoA ligase